MKDMVVSVVIPVQAGDPLGQCLEAVSRQRYEDKEIIIVCDKGAAADASVPAGSEDVRVIRKQKHRALAHLINDGMRASRGHVKILLMPECVPAGDRWMEAMVQPFEDEDVGVVVSRCSPFQEGRPGLGARLTETVWPTWGSGEVGLQEREMVSHCCDAYRASLLADIGYFNESLPDPGGAVETSLRVADAGYSILMNGEALVAYRPGRSEGLGHALKRAVDFGRADALLYKLHDLRWLNAGIYAAGLFALLLAPLSVISLPWAVLVSLAVLAWSGFLSLRLPVVRWDYPVAVLNFVLWAVPVIWLRDGWRPEVFGRSVHPAILRQWFWIGAVVLTYLVLLGKAGLRSAVSACGQPGGLLYAVPVGLARMAWSLCAGAGYLRGLLFDSADRK